MTTKPLVHRKLEKFDSLHPQIQFAGFVDAFEFLKNHPAFKGRFQGILIRDAHWEGPRYKIRAGVVCSDAPLPCEPGLEIVTNDIFLSIAIPAEIVRRKYGDYRKAEKKGNSNVRPKSCS